MAEEPSIDWGVAVPPVAATVADPVGGGCLRGSVQSSSSGNGESWRGAEAPLVSPPPTNRCASKLAPASVLAPPAGDNGDRPTGREPYPTDPDWNPSLKAASENGRGTDEVTT